MKVFISLITDDVIWYDSDFFQNVAQANLHGSDTHKGIQNVVESFGIGVGDDVDNVDALRTQNLMASESNK